MKRLGLAIMCALIAGCSHGPKTVDAGHQIVKITDFELSPDENKIAFSAITPIGNSDIWVVDIDGINLKKLTFKDHSPSNHIARFFQKRKWRNFYTIDMRDPKWTRDGKIAFVQRLIKHDMWGVHAVNVKQWTINPDGTDKRIKADKDEIVRRKPFDSINRAVIFDTSEKHKKKIFLKDKTLWVLDDGDTNPKKLIQ
ncbi:MAG: hypothetical protein ABH815_01970 [Candidatus Omnitrophota bacterium]